MVQSSDEGTDLMGYEMLVQEAMQGVMCRVLERVAELGFPGNHHLYIVFKSDHPDVIMPKHLLEEYPEEITIVLQNQFWDLEVQQDGFYVSLLFSGVMERLFVPFIAVKTFFDPAVSFGLQFKVGDFEEDELLEEDELDELMRMEDKAKDIKKDSKPHNTASIRVLMSSDESPDEEGPEPPRTNVLDLDAFRQKKDR